MSMILSSCILPNFALLVFIKKSTKEKKTSLLLFPLDEVNNSWTNACSDLSDVSSQAPCG
jgi:hypothetical protein